MPGLKAQEQTQVGGGGGLGLGAACCTEEQEKLQKCVYQQLGDKERLLGQRKPWPSWALSPARCSRTKSAQRPHTEGTQTPIATLAGHKEPAAPLTRLVTSGESLPCSEPQFSHL